MSAKNIIKVGDIVVYKHDKAKFGYVCGTKDTMIRVMWFEYNQFMLHFKSQLVKVS
jgi:hypothetical protein